MPQQESNNKKNEENSMAQSMKTMNKIMPIMSAWFCFTLPCGMGLYWIAGSVVRSIQQVVINKYIDRMDFDALIEKNSEKSAVKIAKNAKKMEEMKKRQAMFDEYSKMKTKNIQSKSGNTANASNTANTQQKKPGVAAKANVNTSAASSYAGKAKPGSMMEKANMVREYNERNNSK